MSVSRPKMLGHKKVERIITGIDKFLIYPLRLGKYPWTAPEGQMVKFLPSPDGQRVPWVHIPIEQTTIPAGIKPTGYIPSTKFGVVGDILNIQEPFWLDSPRKYLPNYYKINPNNPDEACYYQAGWNGRPANIWGFKWLNQVMMAKHMWASRLNLHITRIGIEYLQNITPDQMRFSYTYSPGECNCLDCTLDSFRDLWNVRYSHRHYRDDCMWEHNPPVWILKFWPELLMEGQTIGQIAEKVFNRREKH